MKISNTPNILLFDFRTYVDQQPNIIRYETSDREIWYGSHNSCVTSLKIKYNLNLVSNQNLEFLFDSEKEFESIDWKNQKEILKINRFLNLKIKEFTINDIITIIEKIYECGWNHGYDSARNKIQNDLQIILGLKDGKI